MKNNRKVGDYYEGVACDYLKNQGYEILERNYRCRFGEIDIIAREGDFLSFVEVKYRKGKGNGDPGEAISLKKQRTIHQVANYYYMKHGLSLDHAARFDAVLILGESEEIFLIRNAF